jgi:hypothetical protein
MKRSRVRLSIILILSVSLALVCLYRKPQADRVNLTVRFVTYTKDATGANLAVFALSNTGNTPIEVLLPAQVELRHTERNNAGRLVMPIVLSPSRQPWTEKVVVPQTQAQWRVTFDYYPITLRERLSRLAAPLLGRLATLFGIPMRVQVVNSSSAQSEWMDPTVRTDWMEFPLGPTTQGLN